MQKENTSSDSDIINSTSDVNDRKRRIKRIKTAIIILVIILLLLPTICCILLGIRVYRLQQQVDELSVLHSKYGLTYDDEHKDTKYAYAAEKEQETYTSEAPTNTADELQDTSGEITKEEIQGSTRDGAVKNDTGLLSELLSEQHDPTMENDNKKAASQDKDNAEEIDNNKEEENREENKEEKEKREEKDTTVEKDKKEAKDNIKDKDNASNVKEGKYAKKKVYLTFDDGPSDYTDDILDILSEYDIKATFFVVGKTDDWSKAMYQRIIEEGHTLGMHSYSHRYSKIYNSVEDFDKDFTTLWKLLYDTTGYKPSIFRFPGGSDNAINKNSRYDIIRYLREAGIVYFDWNVVNGDATGVEYTKQQLIKNVLDGVEYKENCIVLMHDAQTKKTTVDSLTGLIEAFLSGGAQLLPLSKDVTPIQMIKDDTVQ